MVPLGSGKSAGFSVVRPEESVVGPARPGLCASVEVAIGVVVCDGEEGAGEAGLLALEDSRVGPSLPGPEKAQAFSSSTSSKSSSTSAATSAIFWKTCRECLTLWEFGLE